MAAVDYWMVATPIFVLSELLRLDQDDNHAESDGQSNIGS